MCLSGAGGHNMTSFLFLHSTHWSGPSSYVMPSAGPRWSRPLLSHGFIFLQLLEGFNYWNWHSFVSHPDEVRCWLCCIAHTIISYYPFYAFHLWILLVFPLATEQCFEGCKQSYPCLQLQSSLIQASKILGISDMANFKSKGENKVGKSWLLSIHFVYCH